MLGPNILKYVYIPLHRILHVELVGSQAHPRLRETRAISCKRRSIYGYGNLQFRYPGTSISLIFTILLLWATTDWFAISLCFIFTTLFCFSLRDLALLMLFLTLLCCAFLYVQ